MNSIAVLTIISFALIGGAVSHGHRSRSRVTSSHHRQRGAYYQQGHGKPTPSPETSSLPTAAATTPIVAPSSPPAPTTTDALPQPPATPGSPQPPPSTPVAVPLVGGVKENEGFLQFVDKLGSGFDNKKYDGKDDGKYDNKKYGSKYNHHNEKSHYKQYKKSYEHKNTETCYEMVTKQQLSFKDIEGVGTKVVFGSLSADSASVSITGTYYFYGEPMPQSIIVTTSGTIVLDVNSAGDRGADSMTANLGNGDERPYQVIAPFWSAFTTEAGLNAGDAYYQEADGELIVQWNVNELSNKDAFGGVFQVRIPEQQGKIFFAYKQLNCKNPATGTAQFGVKPAEGKFSEGQRPSVRLSSCINQQYQFPRANNGVILKPADCGDLVGQTGIRKSKNQKSNVYKHGKNDKYNYSDKNDYYDKYDKYGKHDNDKSGKDYYYGSYDSKASDRNDCLDDYFNNFLDSIFRKN